MRTIFSIQEFSIVPIRYQDRMDIMRWRNEQMYHLRQHKPLSEVDQEKYFRTVISNLFEQERPDQFLFSYLENGTCIGYGGLVHINWQDRNAEISFIMETALEKEHFHKHWKLYLMMIEQFAFDELDLHKIYTYAFDLRPHLYEAVEAAGFTREATLKEHCLFENEYKDVVIHSKKKDITIRPALASDVNITYEWATDVAARENSFSSETISLEAHEKWWVSKMTNHDSVYFIGKKKDTRACLIRFDKDLKNDSFVIGINIAPAFRGRGLSHRFLTIACRELLKRRNAVQIDAYIKRENVASIKAFEKAGFQYVGETEVNGHKAFIYQMSQK